MHSDLLKIDPMSTPITTRPKQHSPATRAPNDICAPPDHRCYWTLLTGTGYWLLYRNKLGASHDPGQISLLQIIAGNQVTRVLGLSGRDSGALWVFVGVVDTDTSESGVGGFFVDSGMQGSTIFLTCCCWWSFATFMVKGAWDFLVEVFSPFWFLLTATLCPCP